MKQRSLSTMVSSRRASLGSLAFTLGIVTACGPVPDASFDSPDGAVGSTTQALDQIFAEPQLFGGYNTAPSCQTLANAAYRQELLGDTDEPIDITCSLTLQRLGTQGPFETIKRPLRFGGASSGVVVDCQDQLRPAGSAASVSRGYQELEMIGIRSSYPYPLQTTEDGLYALERIQVDDQEVDDRPHNILIQNCTIEGHVTIAGIRRGHGNDGIRHFAASSHDTDEPEDRDANGRPLHIARVRALGPTDIVFSRVTFKGTGATPLYVNPGVSRVTIIDSVFEGSSEEDVGIYLDAESTENTILNTTLRVTSKKNGWWKPLVWWDTYGREQIAVDGSSYNFLVGNRVSGLNTGGFNLYRNCGEHGAVRYSTPSYNVIVNNQFIYKNYHLSNASRNRYAVHLSSRNGSYSKHNDYCADDTILPGSEPIIDSTGVPIYPTDNNFPRDIDTTFNTKNDNAHDNIVTNNEFLNRTPKSYLKNSSKLNNFTAINREVSDFSSGRKACFSPMSFGRVLFHGNSETVVVPNAEMCSRLTCNNGALEIEPDVDCLDPDAPIAIECTASQDNNGCSNILSCPLGTKVSSVKAACNLESGSVTDAQLAGVPAGNVRVVKASDNVKDGKCYVLSAAVSTGTTPVPVQMTWTAVQSGRSVTIPNENGVRTVSVGCSERDSNGGDCHVRAEFTCE